MTSLLSPTKPVRSPIAPRRPVGISGFVLVAAGVGGWGAAPLLGRPGLAVPALLAGVVLAVLITGAEMRQRRRDEMIARLTDAWRQLMGWRPTDPAPISARRWTCGWPGQPRLIKVRYPSGAVDHDPQWLPEVLTAAGRRLGGQYKTARHDQLRGRLTLKLVGSGASADRDESPAVARAKRVVTELIGPTSTVTNVDVDDKGEVSSLEVIHSAGVKLVASGYRARVERTLSAMLPGRFRALWDMEGDRVRFEVRPALPDSIWIEPLEPPKEDPLSNYDKVEIPFGVDEDGNVMTWRPAISPQMIITGGTGSGKTSTTHAILTRVAQYGWPIWVADGKAVEFLGFRDWPNVQVVASTIEHQVAVIHRAWELMEHRYTLITSGSARVEDFEPLIVFLDEFADLRGNLLSWYSQVKVKGDPTKPPTLAEVASLARKGRTARVHMVMATQRPDAEFLGGEMRDNFTSRISVGRLSPNGAQMMWENPTIGVTLPRGKRGRAIAMNDHGAPVEMQCFRTPDPARVASDSEEMELLDRLRPAESLQERLLILDVEGTADLDTSEPIEPTFHDYSNAVWVRAADRPELDPLNRLDARPGGPTGRALASPMSMLGLNGAGSPISRDRRPRLAAIAAQLPASGMSPGRDLELDDDAGYGPPRSLTPSALSVGDMVLVEGEWVVVDEEPLEDFDDPEDVMVGWRSDNDESGQLLVRSDETLQVRRPCDSFEEG